MTKRRKRRKHIPQRVCVACRTARPKRNLIRIVRTGEGDIIIDETGKRSGRGAYLCRQRICWEKAIKHQSISKALKAHVSDQVVQMLQEHANTLPQSLPTESE
ncbi:MAG TPA: YlxR family protein [Chloroflexi bacterium]|nr:YlxR family protein [Chloroflexota bacterium]